MCVLCFEISFSLVRREPYIKPNDFDKLTHKKPARNNAQRYSIRSARPANLETEMKNKTATKRKYK